VWWYEERRGWRGLGGREENERGDERDIPRFFGSFTPRSIRFVRLSVETAFRLKYLVVFVFYPEFKGSLERETSFDSMESEEDRK
jgi:hypothetical protein